MKTNKEQKHIFKEILKIIRIDLFKLITIF